MHIWSRLILIVLVIGLLLTGCSPTTRIAWRGSSIGDEMSYRYFSFSGSERTTVQAEAQQELKLDYNVGVNKGTLTVRLLDPDRQILWEETFIQDDVGDHSFGPTEDGTYEIIVEGDSTGGHFAISWQVIELSS